MHSPILLLGLALLVLLPLALGARDYYEVLGIDRSATTRDIKKAYRSLSKRYHPDKNPGDDTAQQKFVEVSEAYDVLSTKKTKEIYDKYGHEGLERHNRGGNAAGAAAHDPFDVFSRFFGFGSHGGHGHGHGFPGQHGQRRGPDMNLKLYLPLRDFYTGADHELSIEKQVVCDECDGTGSADRHTDTCSQCGGSGMLVRKQMFAPGIYQQVQTQCGRCGGKGQTISRPCGACRGQRVVRKQVPLFVTVEPGMGEGTLLTFENEADESPDWVAGDIVMQLMEEGPRRGGEDGKDDDGDAARRNVDGTFFRRKGRDLFWKELLSLREAWMGDWTRNITHLDGHVVQLRRERGQVVQPLAVETIRGQGMPVYHEGHMHDHHGGDEEAGALFVEYHVVLPDQMSSGMEKDFWALWQKWRKDQAVDLAADIGKPAPKDEL
ncbi:DnaJ- protein scj1 [Ascosphaera acerosa]|nr:DnaJ- protein scj1 [Ascosphaera acerosa]